MGAARLPGHNPNEMPPNWVAHATLVMWHSYVTAIFFTKFFFGILWGFTNCPSATRLRTKRIRGRSGNKHLRLQNLIVTLVQISMNCDFFTSLFKQNLVSRRVVLFWAARSNENGPSGTIYEAHWCFCCRLCLRWKTFVVLFHCRNEKRSQEKNERHTHIEECFHASTM